LPASADVSSEEDAKLLFDRAFDEFGSIDVVIHAAGVLGPVVNIGDSPVDEWWKAFVRELLPQRLNGATY